MPYRNLEAYELVPKAQPKVRPPIGLEAAWPETEGDRPDWVKALTAGQRFAAYDDIVMGSSPMLDLTSGQVNTGRQSKRDSAILKPQHLYLIPINLDETILPRGYLEWVCAQLQGQPRQDDSSMTCGDNFACVSLEQVTQVLNWEHSATQSELSRNLLTMGTRSTAAQSGLNILETIFHSNADKLQAHLLVHNIGMPLSLLPGDELGSVYSPANAELLSGVDLTAAIQNNAIEISNPSSPNAGHGIETLGRDWAYLTPEGLLTTDATVATAIALRIGNEFYRLNPHRSNLPRILHPDAIRSRKYRHYMSDRRFHLRFDASKGDPMPPFWIGQTRASVRLATGRNLILDSNMWIGDLGGKVTGGVAEHINALRIDQNGTANRWPLRVEVAQHYPGLARPQQAIWTAAFAYQDRALTVDNPNR